MRVRTTMRPDDEIEVGPQEYVDLDRQGLLANGRPRKKADSSASDTGSGTNTNDKTTTGS